MDLPVRLLRSVQSTERGEIRPTSGLQPSSGLRPSTDLRPSSSGIRPSSSGVRPSSSGIRPSSSGARPSFLLFDLSELYQAEEKNRSVDPALLAGEESSRCFGTCHTTLPLNHRQNILQWMCNASLRVGWSYATLHTAISIFDSYALNFHTARAVVQETLCSAEDSDNIGLKGMVVQFKAPPLKTGIAREDLPSLSASCLYLAACLREAVIDQTIISIEEFQKICPEIGSAYVVRTQQVELLGLLKHTKTLGNRTPYDLAQLFIARMALYNQTQIVHKIISATDSIHLCIEAIMNVSIVCYLNTLSLCLPASSWVASTLFHLCQQLIPSVIGPGYSAASQTEMLNCLADDVMCYPGGNKALRQILKIYRPLIRSVFSVMNQQDGSSGQLNGLTTKSRAMGRNLVRPNSTHVFKIPANLMRASFCSYKSPLIIQCRLSILPTLRDIRRDLAAESVLHRWSSATENWQSCAELLIDQENSPVTGGAGKLFTAEPIPKLQHIRRHTSVCKCALCAHYQENPPNWKLLVKYS